MYKCFLCVYHEIFVYIRTTIQKLYGKHISNICNIYTHKKKKESKITNDTHQITRRNKKGKRIPTKTTLKQLTKWQ